MDTRKTPPHFGRMNDPTASAYVKGACGDEMEFYLVIGNDRLQEVRFFTGNGCADTIAAGEAAAAMVEGRTVQEALGVNPKAVHEAAKDNMPGDGRHCAILAVIALLKALADYMLAP